MAGEKNLEIRTENKILFLTLNRPDKFNALSTELMGLIEQQLDSLSWDKSIRTVIIAANGKAFCAGHDLREMSDDPGEEAIQALFDQCSRMMVSLTQIPQPVIARVHGMATAALDGRIESLARKLDMGWFLDQRNETLSSGMRQKVSIARALVHDPEILLFDELTTGLDVAAAESVLTVVAACKSEGRTVLFSTHHMDEVDQLCDSVVIIHEGKLCFEGSVDAMRSQTGETFLDKAFLKLIKPKTEETTQ